MVDNNQYNTELVSVIIPTYNCRKYIRQAIDSALAQTYKNIEIIVVDDGSSDNTREEIGDLISDKKILYIYQANKGLSGARNTGIKHSKGEYLVFLDSDDIILPEKIMSQVGFMKENSQVCLVYSRYQYFKNDNLDEVISHPYALLRGNLYKDLIRGNFFIVHSVLVKKKCVENIGGFDESLSAFEDWDLWIRMADFGCHFDYIDEILCLCRLRPDSMSMDWNRIFKSWKKVISKILTTSASLTQEDRFALKYTDIWKSWETIYYQLRSSVGNRVASDLQDTIKATRNLYDLIPYSIRGTNIIHKREECLSSDTNEIIESVMLIMDLYEKVYQCSFDIQKKDAIINEKNTTIQRMLGSKSWRVTAPLRKLENFMGDFNINFNSTFFKQFKKQVSLNKNKKDPYNLWISKNEPDSAQLSAMRSESKSWAYWPRVSIISPVYNPGKYDLTQCIQSVIDQVYDNWELCIVDGGSDKSYVRKIIEKYAKRDSRIKFTILSKNLGIAGNSNEALKLATGEFVAFLDHDDMLAPFALYEVVKLLNQDSTIDFIYSDEDKVYAQDGKRYEPFFKPGWSPDTLLSYNYACHFAVVRKRIIDEIGGFREGFDGAQDYDLILRVIQKTTNIKRIPKILYHWRASKESIALSASNKPLASDAGKRAISEYLKNKGLEAEILDGQIPTWYRVKYSVKPHQKVCIIIPIKEKDKVSLLNRCITSILTKTNYKDYEILIIDNQSDEQETYQYFDSLKNELHIKIIQYNKSFNYSAINNFAVQSTDAEYLLFLNNDTEVISEEWLSSMLEFAQREDVGAVGAKLYYPDDTIQHAGVIIGLRGIADHPHRHFPRSSHGYFGRINIIQNFSAVTAGCMMMRRKAFEEVGGFDEKLPVVYNDVDLCLKLREKNYLIVYTPYAELYHYEPGDRGCYTDTLDNTMADKEKELMKSKWKHILESNDPYYNPNLTLDKTDFSIRL